MVVVAAAPSGLRDSSAAASGRGTARIPREPTPPRLQAREEFSRRHQEQEGTGSGDCAVGLGERRHRASRPRRAHHGQLLGHRGPALRAARVSASHR